MQVAKETFLPATERKECHWRCNANVDADIPGLGFIPELARRRATGRKYTCLITILPAIDQFQCIIDRIDMHDAQHGTKDFSARQLAARRDVMDHGGLDEISAFITAHC